MRLQFAIMAGLLFTAPVPGQSQSAGDVDSIVVSLVLKEKYKEANTCIDNYITSFDAGDQALLILRRAEIDLINNRYAEAETKMHEALSCAGLSNADGQFILRYDLDQAELLRAMGRFKKAKPFVEKSLVQLKHLKTVPPFDAFRLCLETGKMYYENHQFHPAKMYCKKSLNLLKGEDSFTKALKLTSASLLRLTCLADNNATEAYLYEKMSEELFDNISQKDDPVLLPYYINTCLINFHYQYDPMNAQYPLDQAQKIIEDAMIPGNICYGLLYYFKSQMAYYQRESEKAIGYFNEASSYLDKYPDLLPYMVLFHFNQANLWYFHKNDYKKALQLYKQISDSRNPWIMNTHTTSLILSGYCHLDMGDSLSCFKCMNQAIHDALWMESVPNKELVYAYRCLGSLFLASGKREEAFKYLQKALDAAARYKANPALFANILSNLGNYFRDSGKPEKSLSYYNHALKTLKTLNLNDKYSFIAFQDDAEFIDILNNQGYALSLLFEETGNIQMLKEGLFCQDTAIMAIEKRIHSLDDENSEFSWISLVKISYDNAVSFAAKLFEITHDFQYAEKAFQYAEKSRMLVLLIESQDNKIRLFSGMPDTLIHREKVIHDRIFQMQNTIYQMEKESDNCDDITSMKHKLAVEQLSYDKLKLLYKQNYKQYYNLKYNVGAISLKQLQNNLTDDQVLIEYQLLENELIIMAINRNGFEIRQVKSSEFNTQNIQEILDLLTVNPAVMNLFDSFQEFTTLSHNLYLWLLAPIGHLIINKRIIIIPHKELNLLPFEVLIKTIPGKYSSNDFAGLDYLVNTNPVSYAYSATLLFEHNNALRDRKPAFFSAWKGQNTKGEIVELKGALEEIDEAWKISGGKKYLGENASETHFKEVAGKYGLLHIASHTALNEENPMLSAVILMPDSFNDGQLYSYELYQLKLKAKLVILSGCNTGVGPLQQGEGILSLSRSFYYAGCRSIAYFLWPEPDKSSTKIVAGFYQGMHENKTLDKALQISKLKYLSSSDPIKSHPYYWSGLVINGRTETIKLENFYSMGVILFVSLIILADFTWLFRKNYLSIFLKISRARFE